MDTKIIIGGLIILIIIIVILVFALKSDNSGKKQVTLDRFTATLRDINNRLSTVKTCIDSTDRDLFNQVGYINVQAKNLMKEVNVYIKPSSVTAYNNAFTAVQATIARIIKNYQPCKPADCFQAQWNEVTKTCVCPAPYTNQVANPNGAGFYCFKDKCDSTVPNVSGYNFIKNPTPDPTQNPAVNCVCNTGFEHDDPTLPNPEYCWNTANSAALDGLTGQFTAINVELNKEFPST
jgi:hypothetical protein